MAALSSAAVTKVCFDKGVGAAQRRAWFHFLGDGDSPGVLGVVWDGAHFSYCLKHWRILGGRLQVFSRHGSHPPPHSSTAQPASWCQKNLPEMRCASRLTVTSCSDCCSGLVSPVTSRRLIPLQSPVFLDSPKLLTGVCLSSILTEKRQPGCVMCEEEEAAPSADLWGLLVPSSYC